MTGKGTDREKRATSMIFSTTIRRSEKTTRYPVLNGRNDAERKRNVSSVENLNGDDRDG